MTGADSFKRVLGSRRTSAADTDSSGAPEPSGNTLESLPSLSKITLHRRVEWKLGRIRLETGHRQRHKRATVVSYVTAENYNSLRIDGDDRCSVCRRHHLSRVHRYRSDCATFSRARRNIESFRYEGSDRSLVGIGA